MEPVRVQLSLNEFNPNHDRLGRFSSGSGGRLGPAAQYEERLGRIFPQVNLNTFNGSSWVSPNAIAYGMNGKHHSVGALAATFVPPPMEKLAIDKMLNAGFIRVHTSPEALSLEYIEGRMNTKTKRFLKTVAISKKTVYSDIVDPRLGGNFNSLEETPREFIMRLHEFNPFHDRLGRFASGPGGRLVSSAKRIGGHIQAATELSKAGGSPDKEAIKRETARKAAAKGFLQKHWPEIAFGVGMTALYLADPHTQAQLKNAYAGIKMQGGLREIAKKAIAEHRMLTDISNKTGMPGDTLHLYGLSSMWTDTKKMMKTTVFSRVGKACNFMDIYHGPSGDVVHKMSITRDSAIDWTKLLGARGLALGRYTMEHTIERGGEVIHKAKASGIQDVVNSIIDVRAILTPLVASAAAGVWDHVSKKEKDIEKANENAWVPELPAHVRESLLAQKASIFEFNPYHDPRTGRFTTGSGGGGRRSSLVSTQAGLVKVGVTYNPSGKGIKADFLPSRKRRVDEGDPENAPLEHVALELGTKASSKRMPGGTTHDYIANNPLYASHKFQEHLQASGLRKGNPQDAPRMGFYYSVNRYGNMVLRSSVGEDGGGGGLKTVAASAIAVYDGKGTHYYVFHTKSDWAAQQAAAKAKIGLSATITDMGKGVLAGMQDRAGDAILQYTMGEFEKAWARKRAQVEHNRVVKQDENSYYGA